jgi:hypothetical protein
MDIRQAARFRLFGGATDAEAGSSVKRVRKHPRTLSLLKSN